MAGKHLSTRAVTAGTGRRDATRSGGVVLVATASLLASSLATLPASAAPLRPDEKPIDQWSSPYSPLPQNQIAAPKNAIALGFDSARPGATAPGSLAGTGFTVALPAETTPGEKATHFRPEQISIAEGQLRVAAGGTLDEDANSLTNGLGVGLDPVDATLRISADLPLPAVGATLGDTGLWFGTSQDDVVKLVLAPTSDGGRAIELVRELAGEVPASPEGTVSLLDAALVPADPAAPAETLRLTLDVDPVGDSLTAAYQVGDADPAVVGRIELPAALLNGSTLLSDPLPDAPVFAGILAEASEEDSEAPTIAAFDAFTVEPLPVSDEPAQESPAPDPTESPAPSPTPSAEPSPTPFAEPSPTPSAEPSPAPSAGHSPAPSAGPSPAPSAGPSPAPSAEPSPPTSPESPASPAPEPSTAKPEPSAPTTPAPAPAPEPEGPAPAGDVPAAVAPVDPASPAPPASGVGVLGATELLAAPAEPGVLLTWSPSAGASSYEVQRSTDPAFPVAVTTSVSGASGVKDLKYSDVSAEPGLTYYYRVIATDGEGAALPPSNVAEIVLLKTAETCTDGLWNVQYFEGTALEGSAIVAGCEAEIDQEFKDGEGPDGVDNSDYSARWEKTFDGEGAYTFTVRADDGVRLLVDGESVFDNWDGTTNSETSRTVDLAAGEHTVTVEYFQAKGGAFITASYATEGEDTEKPVAPSDLSARTTTDGDAADKAVELSWKASPSSDSATYRVYRSTAGGAADTGSVVSELPADTTTYEDTTAVIGEEYSYALTAVDTAGNESAQSNESMITLAATDDAVAPAVVTGLKAVGGDTSVALSWTASSATDLTGYTIYRSLQPDVAATGSALSGAGTVQGVTYTDSTAVNGTTYFYTITATDSSGNESAMSAEVWAVPNVPNTTRLKVDFTAAGAPAATGYLLDWGEAYGTRTGAGQGSGQTYGWKTADGNPVSLVGNGRDRNRAGIDPRLDSIIHLQYGDDPGTNGIKTEGVWEAAVPNGLYSVTVAVGDMKFGTVYDSLHAINIETGVGIESFQSTTAAEYKTQTTVVGVWDGALTLTAAGGKNTKLAYVDIVGLDPAPHVDTMRPDNRSTGHDPNDGVSATIRVPYAGVGVDARSLPGNVHIYDVATGGEVPSTTGTSGGNDVISTQPSVALKPNSNYRFVVTSGVKDNYGVSFVPFTSVFTTGAGVVEVSGDFTPLRGVNFERVEQPEAAGTYWSSMTFGPDGKMYASSIGQGLYRFTVGPNGALTNKEALGYEGRAIIGLVFDKAATASNLRVWITSTSANTENETGEWVSGVSLLTGAQLQVENQVFVGLPRSQADHLTNSMAYGPDGRLYFMQGSNQAAGDLDNSWGQRGEKLLTAATLVFDPKHPAVQQAATSNAPINVQTSGGGTYNPYAAGAPLQIYATGIRNAYDLVWHSNGHLYVPTNGTAGNANSPGVTANADGTFTRVAASGIPGYSSVNGKDVTAQCKRRNYTGGSVPAVANHPTQQDLLFDVVQGGYYGHPNPERCEWVLNEGNDPANPPKYPGQGGSKYASGVKADPNYRGIAYNFEFNKSPNGAIEYKSDSFGGQLRGRLIVTRFSNNNDLIFLQPDPTSGKILGAQTSVGITGVSESTIGNVSGFNDPLEVVEDPNTGNLYVNQYDRSGTSQKMFLLRVPATQQPAAVRASVPEVVFSAVKSTTSAAKPVVVTNTTNATLTFNASLTGANSGEFRVSGGAGVTLAPGASATVNVTFAPGTTVGQRSAILHLDTGSSTLDVGLYGLTMNGIEGTNEPTLLNVLGTLGYNLNPGWTNLEGGTQATAKGDEVLKPLFVKAGQSPVTMKPLAQYAPREDLPFGWYTGNAGTDQRHKLGSIAIEGYQSLLPPVSTGTTSTFDPGTSTFGFYYYSNAFQRFGYTEDRLNTGIAHRARVYPAKNRQGVPISDSYIVAFEDASNGDYQDYMFLVTGVRPAGEGPVPVPGGIKVNFSNLAAALPAGYLRDFGEAFGPRTRSDQPGGLQYGWKSQSTANPIDLSTGGSSGLGNGRERTVAAQTDQRLRTLMHMQAADVTNFNGVPAYAYWEIALAAGEYDVTVAVGDTLYQSAPEAHSINLEGQSVINRFVPTGGSGAPGMNKTVTARVTVSDGLLTVDAKGGTNTKIDYIDIVPASGPITGDDPTDGAQVKVNFQTTTAPTPVGWTADTGAAYSTTRKSGWLVNGTPTDRSGGTRYRTSPTTGIDFPAGNVLLQTHIHMGPATGFPSAVWEYDVPNGTYSVAASVGDSAFLDSTHGVSAEGQPLVAAFVPTGSTPFQTGVRDVTVTDGKLTLASTGTNTKLDWVSIKGDALSAVPASAPEVKYNFQLPSTPVPAGWTADNGGAYDQDGYGWFVNGTPTDRFTSIRNRPKPTTGITYPADPTLQSLAQMQETSSTGVWQKAVGNGFYQVSIAVGDAGYLDSTHSVAIEGKTPFEPFVPTGAAPFKQGTVTVEVKDGLLTLVPTGTNTKINWVSIKGENLSVPSIQVVANGSEVGTSYSGGTAQVALSATAPTGSTIASLTYSLNGAAPVAYAAPFTLETTGNYTLGVTAVDSAGRSFKRTTTFEILNVGGTLVVRNDQATRSGTVPAPGFSEDWLVMHRLNGGVTTHKVVDEATATLSNTGTKDLRISDAVLKGLDAGQFTLVDLPARPFVIPAGGSVTFRTKFVGATGLGSIRTAQLDLTSSDAAKPVTTVQLRGLYQVGPEGDNELPLATLVQSFGWTTNVGAPKNGDENPTSALNGEEVRSQLWKRADTTKPVTVRQIAAFHGCCTATETINIAGTTAQHGLDYGQTTLPPNRALTGPTQLSVSPTTTFPIVVAGQSTRTTTHLAIKTWPVRDRAGAIVPNTWIVGHDYITAANQCGVGVTNCDYQDNVYLMTNAAPAGTADTTPPAAPAGLTAAVNGSAVALDWADNMESDLAGYHVERSAAAAGPWTRLTSTALVSTSAFSDVSAPAGSTSYYRVLALDTAANASATSAVVNATVPGSPPPPPVAGTVRINAGGPAVTADGLAWAADTNFVGGKTFTNTKVTQIAGTTADPVYLTERSGASFGYDVPLPSGSYTVKLHFAEIWHGATGGGPGGTGKRVFDVNFEGGPVEIAALDLNAKVAPMTAYVDTRTVSVTDGNLDMDFTATVDQAKISGIEIIPAG
ncbi:malectin domain-containing carbohydrate-binding protein [Arthrobacter sp. MDT3-44]